jgi:transcriptional regulator with XRE-family HTH domain
VTMGQRIAAAREAAGMTREGLAKAAGVSISWVEKYEEDRRPQILTRRLALVAGVLGIDPETLRPGSREEYEESLQIIAQRRSEETADKLRRAQELGEAQRLANRRRVFTRDVNLLSRRWVAELRAAIPKPLPKPPKAPKLKPQPPSSDQVERLVADARVGGTTYRQLALLHSMSIGQVRRFCRAAGVPGTMAQRSYPTARHLQIRDRYEAGTPVDDIATEFKLSAQRVYQLVGVMIHSGHCRRRPHAKPVQHA